VAGDTEEDELSGAVVVRFDKGIDLLEQGVRHGSGFPF